MPSVIRSAVLMTAIACSMSCTAQAPSTEKAAAKAAKPASGAALGEKQKNSTMIGMDIAKSLEPIKDEIDVDALTAALKASLAGKPTKLTQAEADALRSEFGMKMQAKMQKKAAEAGEKNLREGAAFLAALPVECAGDRAAEIRAGEEPLVQPGHPLRAELGQRLDRLLAAGGVEEPE